MNNSLTYTVVHNNKYNYISNKSIKLGKVKRTFRTITFI